jgi:hypothetical protein
MPTKTPSIISSVLTILLLLLIGAFVFFIDLIALNGVSGSDGGIALTTLGICEGIILILFAVLAGRFTTFLITKYSWNKFWAVAIPVITLTVLALALDFAAVLLSVGVAEALFYN